MAETNSPAHPSGLGATQRKDLWWLGPAATLMGFIIGFGYLTWAAVFGVPEHGEFGNYLSPVYSPPLHHWFPALGAMLPDWFSPALLILWAPGGFRATCYYYRKAYYRAGFATPPGCAVQGLPLDYSGETKFPFILQNIHRYFMYLAVIFIFWFLPLDVWNALWFATPDGGTEFGIGLGTLVLLANNLVLAGYTLGCHSFRHLIGGKTDCYSCEPGGKLRYSLWEKVTKLNEHHMFWAWTSLAVVGSTDLFVRLLATGVISDVRFF